MRCKTLQFCGRVFLYSEEDLPDPELERLSREAEQTVYSFSFVVRGLPRSVPVWKHQSRSSLMIPATRMRLPDRLPLNCQS